MLAASERLFNPDELRARAERYRRLAESLFDPNIVAVVLNCARELDQDADELIETRSWAADLSN